MVDQVRCGLRHAPHEGQIARLLQLKATRLSWPQSAQRRRRKPWARMPHSRADLLHKIVAGVAMDAGVDGFIPGTMAAAPDHAATLYFPEGEYPKGLVVRRR